MREMTSITSQTAISQPESQSKKVRKSLKPQGKNVDKKKQFKSKEIARNMHVLGQLLKTKSLCHDIAAGCGSKEKI